jgi:hypothetical protein
MAALNISLIRLPSSASSPSSRIQLDAGDVHSLPAQSQMLCVVAGCAWVSLNGKDVIVRRGETLALTGDRRKHNAVLSALGGEQLVCEVGAMHSPQALDEGGASATHASLSRLRGILMITLQQFTSVFLRFNRARVQQREQAVKPHAAETSAPSATAADEEKAFLASIANLPPEERECKLARRAWYRQLAERQGVIEAERRADQDWWK